MLAGHVTKVLLAVMFAAGLVSPVLADDAENAGRSACMKVSVENKQNAYQAVKAVREASVNAAKAARDAALSGSIEKPAKKAALKTYKESLVAARKAYYEAKKATKQTYSTARKACAVKVSKDGVNVDLLSQNNSGISGKAMLKSNDGKVEVKLNMTGVASGAVLPAHIHIGSCPTPGPVKYPLTNVVNGKSETELTATFPEIKAGLPLAINVHKSAAEAGVYVACGDLKF
ncbi:MAG: hypothetical protein A3B23_02860 [Candidatus Colwellbacteria bacterium RIFCSPLOWO2_01_FULL_48_10]|uniref:CHRD domain-containing protein n=1 Tax=Candidatus Colwellbacteria bacterium RIFCSPLOWO2_01_FULL_48_10 TaxID=1797690 RepID=A0A1G1Z6W3_9BACT|nr:MAG: hypothetical protein A3B23_02860 [Candidatus Colwellbacteria bacterium RIFCSPLOWO2_01_FULL_48_10]